MNPIVPWIGGKRRLADVLIPRFPPHRCYLEVFAGGAALFFLRPPAEVEVLNDTNNQLVNFYRVVQHHPDELVRQFRWVLNSRQAFEWLKMTPPETLTDIQCAARFYFLQRESFGARVEGQTFGTATTGAPGLNLDYLPQELAAAHRRLSRAFIENLDWQACLLRYDRPHTFAYLDPPYWMTEGYGVPFEFAQYERMAELLKGIQGKAIVSLNDHPDMRAVFAGYEMETLDIQYTVGGGGHPVCRSELIVYSWDRELDPVGLF